MIPAERVSGKFTRAIRERLAAGSEIPLVTKRLGGLLCASRRPPKSPDGRGHRGCATSNIEQTFVCATQRLGVT